MEKLRDKPENVDWEEFVPLVGEWREEKTLKAKCPYCVKPIEKQATKCIHCFSELEWFKFDGLYGPCKAGASEEMEARLIMARTTLATLHAAIEEEKAKLEKEEKAKLEAKKENRFADTLARLEKAKCGTCNKPAFSNHELQEIVETGVEQNLYNLESWRRHHDFDKGYECIHCRRSANILWSGVVFIVLILGILLVAAIIG
ncbi:MAG: hypothetical protein ACON4R_11985 [Akkermansiaceae bacterium]